MISTSASGLPRANTACRAPMPRSEQPSNAAIACPSASSVSAPAASRRASARASEASTTGVTAAVALATALTVGGGSTWVRSTGASPKQASTPASRQKASRLSVAAASRLCGVMGG